MGGCSSKSVDEISQQVCLITGASSGVGAEAAKTFAKAGMRVVLTARREDKLKELVAEITAAGGRAAYILLDVSDNSQVEEAFAFAEKTFGGVDFVFANAGFNGNVLLPLTDKPAEEISQNLMINTAGAIHTLRSAVPAFRKRGGGAIVFTSSIFAHQNYKSQAAMAAAGFAGGGALVYNAAKAAIDAVNRNAGQFASENIRSYSLQIGAFDTEMSRNSAKQASAAFGADVPVTAFGANNPIFDTVGDAVHVGQVALALFDGSSAWQSGQTIVVDNDGTADAAAWTSAVDAPLSTDTGLPTKEAGKALVRDIAGRPYSSSKPSFKDE